MSININNYINSFEFDFTLPGSNEIIMFKPLTTGQLKKLLPYENEKNPEIIESLLDNLISNCVVSEGFDINTLYLQDRFALLVEIRKKSKGETYEFIYDCPECNNKKNITLDLNELSVKKKDYDTKTFIFNDKLSFELDGITRGDQIMAAKMVNKLKIKNENLKQAEIATYMFAMSMKTFHTPEGDTKDVPMEAKINLIDNIMNDEQYNRFTNHFTENDFGVDFKFDFGCDCGKTEKFVIPMNNFFI